ncbi:MAG: nucleotidyltransferase family protein [Thermodesulfobacteriota bacterium]
MRHAAIILAAGDSGRMGTDKARLPLGPVTVVEHVIAVHRAAGAGNIVVVSGRNTSALAGLPLDAVLVENPRPEEGMFSSVQAGVRVIAPETEAFFIHPVDIPLVPVSVLERILEAAEGHPGRMVLVPAAGGRRGHPPLIRAGLKATILAEKGDGGLRAVLNRAGVFEVACGEPGILRDMDTPETYLQLKQQFS